MCLCYWIRILINAQLLDIGTWDFKSEHTGIQIKELIDVVLGF
jgi:hypothetical protein